MIPHNAPVPFHVYDWHRNEQPLRESGYSTDLIAAEFERVIASQSDDRPFFIYVPFNAVHGPIDVVPRHTETYDARDAALKCYDEAVGRIMKAIEQGGFADKTLLVVTNDNGGLTEESNRPFRGTKNTTYEGGVRVPCVMRWPGRTTPASETDVMMHITDFFATFVTLAGGSLDQPRRLDSIDVSAALFGAKRGSQLEGPRDEIIYEVTGSVRIPTIRKGDFKLMGDVLYNIRTDPGETTDVTGAHPELVGELKKRLAQAASERPPLGDKPILMRPALPYVYGEIENRDPPAWLVRAVDQARAKQPQHWPPGETPWPQAPKTP
jgi:arylsulfatase A-like enzyme